MTRDASHAKRATETAKGGQQRRPWSIILTAGLVGLIALSVAMAEGYLAVIVVCSIIAMVILFRLIFHSSQAFLLALANLVGVYACVFLFFAETNFRHAGITPLLVGFVLPLAAFVAGAGSQRDAIAEIIATGRVRDQRHFARIFSWLLPVFAIGAATFLSPEQGEAAELANVTLLVAMAAISGIVFLVSRDVAIFLLDTGLLFEAFFERMTSLIVPAFAFLTFYSLLVILFASLYTVLDHLAGGPHFRIGGALRAITFPESLFFSVTTLSTVGYGDIVPAGNAARLLAAIEIVCGVLLFLFGVNELFSFSQRRPTTRDSDER